MGLILFSISMTLCYIGYLLNEILKELKNK
jgi:hypothetical protein